MNYIKETIQSMKDKFKILFHFLIIMKKIGIII